MELDPEEPVDLCKVRSPFEAETIAACLQDRGFRAVALTLVARTVQWGGGITNVPRIQIPRCELREARTVLAAVKEQAKFINWDEVLERAQTGALGSTCAYCDAARDGLDPSLPCVACGMPAAPLLPQLSEPEVERMRQRSRKLLYLGIFLICLPFIFAAIASTLNRLF